MAQINDHFLKLKAGYLFPEIARRVAAFAQSNPQAKIIRMGIGDVTEPLPPAVVAAMHQAVEEMAHRETFRGYGPEQGYEFLREAIAKNEYQARSCDVAADEIFISDGAKCDTGNILDIFSARCRVAVTDPVYPVYVDTNVMAGHTGPASANGRYAKLVYLPVTAENNFTAPLPKKRVDLVYLCSPDNPTGNAMTRAQLLPWIQYAKANQSILFFDAAYEAYITDSSIPHSIYELSGARDVAIEFRSFSKLGGFTGVRCAFCVIPQTLQAQSVDGLPVQLHKLWLRRHTTKFNGVSYITQRGAEALYSPEGRQQARALVEFYMTNARLIREGLAAIGLRCYGGVNAPYVWVKTPGQSTSWEFFDRLLRDCHVVGTPGSGFGAAGEGYLRLSAFNSRQNVEEAIQRMRAKIRA